MLFCFNHQYCASFNFPTLLGTAKQSITMQHTWPLTYSPWIHYASSSPIQLFLSISGMVLITLSACIRSLYVSENTQTTCTHRSQNIMWVQDHKDIYNWLMVCYTQYTLYLYSSNVEMHPSVTGDVWKHYARYGHHFDYVPVLHHKYSSSNNFPPPPIVKLTDCAKFLLTVVTHRRIGASPSFSLASSKLDDFARKPE